MIDAEVKRRIERYTESVATGLVGSRFGLKWSDSTLVCKVRDADYAALESSAIPPAFDRLVTYAAVLASTGVPVAVTMRPGWKPPAPARGRRSTSRSSARRGKAR